MLMKSYTSTEVIPGYIEIGDVHINCKKGYQGSRYYY